MIALVVVSTFVVLVLGVLVAGLLRSHADILRSLHELGVGVGDPAAAATAAAAGNGHRASTAAPPRCRWGRPPAWGPSSWGTRRRWPVSPRPAMPGPSR